MSWVATDGDVDAVNLRNSAKETQQSNEEYREEA
jgi:hypothetical protein